MLRGYSTFILVGALMEEGELIERLTILAGLGSGAGWAGHPCHRGMYTVCSGIGLATASAIGSIMIPAMITSTRIGAFPEPSWLEPEA